MSTKPIYVYEGGGSNPHIITAIDTGKFSDHDSRAESAVISRKVNDISTIEVVIPANCEASKAITHTSDLVLYDTAGNLQEFHITDIDDLDEYSVTRTIYAESSFGELINNIVTADTAMPTTKDPADYLAYILSFTRWSVGTVESGLYDSKWEEDITGLTCLEAFQKLIDKYNCEFVIRYETDGKNKITGRFVDLKKSIGHNYGKRFEDSKDILGLKSSLDLDSIKTSIYPRIRKDFMDENGNSRTEYVDISSVVWSKAAGDPVDKPLGQTVLVDPDADSMYKRYNNKTGKLMERVMYAEWTNESAVDAEDLCSQAWAILRTNSVLNPTIKVTAGDLYRMSGDDPDYSHEQVDLGDTCIIIDRNFDPELRLTTRVMEMEEDILNPVNNTYVFGSYRKTLATSNIERQKSIEEQITDLYNKLQGVKVDYEMPYQSGKASYQEIKESVRNEFMSASGYVMAEDSDGFWVLDAPVSTYSLRARTSASPTKAVILKGGMLGFAQYNTVTSEWEVGTFIDGMSVNADYINTGHLNADVITAGSIKVDHLSTAAVEYIKTGMATEEDLQGVIDSVANDYATKDSVSSNINNAVKDLVSTSNMNSAISNATKDMATNSSVSSAISSATKDLATNSSVNSAINNATKDMATNSSVNSAISNATKDFVTDSSVNDRINGAINNITLGGRNIATKTNQGITGWSWSTKTGGSSKVSVIEDGINCCKFTRDNVGITGWSVIGYSYINRNMYRTNTKYTVSFEVKSSVTSGNISCSLRLGNGNDTITNIMSMGAIHTANAWIKLSCILTTVNEFPADTGQMLYLTGFNETTGAVYTFRNLKIEEGTKPSAWSPAPEDVEEQNRLTRINAIKDLQKQLQTEYNETYNKANTIYTDKYLAAGSTEKTTLNSKMTAYTTAYNNYNNFITTMIADNTVTDSEYTSYTTYADAYSTALEELAVAMEKANNARLANVYAQARQGLVTTAELEVNNQSVIASAKAGMVSTGDMTSAIDFATQDLVSNNALSSAINNIKIGGTNLAKQTKKLTSKTGDVNWKITSTGTEGFNKLYLDSTSTNWVECQIPLYTEINTLTSPVTISFEYMESTAGLFLFSFAPYNGATRLIELANKEVSSSFTLIATRAGWKYVSFTFDPSSLNGQAGATEYKLQLKKVEGKTGSIHVRKIKVEIGTKATEWTPAPQDVTDYTDNAVKDKVTTTQMNSAINTATNDMATNSSVNTAISNATNDMATNAGVTNAINGITVGSRNLALLTSDEWVSFTGFSGATNDCRLSYTVLIKGLSVNDKVLVAFDYKLENMTYTSNQSPTIRLQGSGDVTQWNSGQFPTVNVNLSSKPANATGTAYGIANIYDAQLKNGCWYCNFRTDYLTGGTVSIRGIRVIRSSKLVSWIAAPEDAYTNTVFETFRAITAEYNNNYKIATTLYSNSYLGGTAKTNLKTAYDDYATKYNAVKSAHDAISTSKHAGEGREATWKTALTNLQSSTTTLAQRVQEASTFINTAVYNASKSYTDTAIPDALTGYAKTSYVDSAKAAAIADAKKGMVSTSQLEVNNTEILMKTASMGQYNILRNSDFRSGTDYWTLFNSSTVSAWGIVNDSDGVVIAGERCMRTWCNSSGSATVWNGYYQDVTLAGGTSYTLSYWLSSYNCTARVSVWKGTANDTTIAYKTYDVINGNHNRASWKYDSITFTTSTAGTYRMFFQTKDTPASGGYGLFLIKPMLCTGINAQAWTAHPDEIHVGVVSVTEQNGIMVEHSDFSTYSVLNAAGLKVFKNDKSLVASFGESGSAYIGDLSCDGYVKAPQLMPVSKQIAGGVLNIYCSETGSGNFSGDSSNYAQGWAGAMRVALSYLGIDYTHTEGGFIINSNTSNKKSLVIRIYIKGSTFTNNIELHNVYGVATFQIYFDAGCKFTGQMKFYNIEPELDIKGNNTAVLHRGSSSDYAIICENVSLLFLHHIYVNYTNAGSYNYPVYAHHTNCYFAFIDFCNCSCMVDIQDSYLKASYCQGSMNYYVANGDRSFVNFTSSTIPVADGTAPYVGANNVSKYTSSFSPTGSSQSGASSVTINVTKTFNGDTYASFRSMTYRSGVLIQGSPNAEELNKYGNYYGRIYFNSSTFAAAMNSITNPVVQLYLERKASISSATDYVDVYIAGTNVGVLQSESGKWFNVPTAAINSLKNGSGYIEINATGVDNYTQYSGNSVLKITGTQTL